MIAVHPAPAPEQIAALVSPAPATYWCAPSLPARGIAGWVARPGVVYLAPWVCRGAAQAVRGRCSNLARVAVSVVLHEQAHVDGVADEREAWAWAVRRLPPVCEMKGT